MIAVWAVLAALLLVKWVSAVNGLCASLAYLRRPTGEEDAPGPAPRVYVTIPLLREQRVLPELLARFTRLTERFAELHLVLVTTEREILEAHGVRQGTTIALIEAWMETLAPETRAKISHLHYPTRNTVVAEQLNFAAKTLSAEAGPPATQRYLLVYNADSVVDEGSISALLRHARAGVAVAQQCSLYLWNVPSLLAARRYLLAAHGLFQSRWTLQIELPRFLRSSRHARPAWLARNALAHCISHGLLLRLDVLTSAGGFPMPRIGVEDLGLGFVLKAMGYPIEPVPVLENAETPDQDDMAWLQKAGWFIGALGYLGYWRLVPSSVRRAHPVRVALLTLQGGLQAANWLLGGPLVILFLLLGAWVGQLAVSAGLYLAYVYTPLLALHFLWSRLPPSTFPRSRGLNLAGALLVYPLVPLLHSAPAFHGLGWAIGGFLGRPIHRPKTERL